MGNGDNEEANSMKKFWDYQEKCAKINMQIRYLDNVYQHKPWLLCFLNIYIYINTYIKVLDSTIKVLNSSFQVLSDALTY